MLNNYKQILEEAKQLVLQTLAISFEDGWSKEPSREGYMVYSRPNINSELKINRTETNANVDPEEFIRFVIDMERKQEYDQNFLEGRLIEQLDDSTFIYYARGKPPTFFIEARDFILLTKIYKFQDGTVMAVSKSIEHPLIPSIKGVQRANILFSAWIAKRISQNMSNIQLIGCLDPCGEIPKAIINLGAKFQQEGVRRVIEYVTKQKQ